MWLKDEGHMKSRRRFLREGALVGAAVYLVLDRRRIGRSRAEQPFRRVK